MKKASIFVDSVLGFVIDFEDVVGNVNIVVCPANAIHGCPSREAYWCFNLSYIGPLRCVSWSLLLCSCVLALALSFNSCSTYTCIVKWHDNAHSSASVQEKPSGFHVLTKILK